MDRKSLPPILLCVLVLIFWGPLFDTFWPQPKRLVSPGQTNQLQRAGQPSSLPQVATTSGTTAPAAIPGMPLQYATKPPPVATHAKLENQHVEVLFSSQGGGIASVRLKSYRRDDKKPVILNQESPLPVLAITLADIPLTAEYELVQSSPEKVQAIHRSPGGLVLTKEFTLQSDYQIGCHVTVQNPTSQATGKTAPELAIGMIGPITQTDTMESVGITALSNQKAFLENLSGIHKQVEKQQKPYVKEAAMAWTALRAQYFALILTPSDGSFSDIQATSHPLNTPHPPNTPAQQGLIASVHLPAQEIAAGGSWQWKGTLYAGPKEYKRLSTLGNGYDKLLNYGWFETIAKGLLWLMEVVHGFFGNWGIAIIAVTILIKIVFWPLTAISTRSMKQMQALSPKMNALKEKHGNDSKKINEEMMKLYRDYRINPMAGCLPMIVQIPIFIAFYNMLSAAIELRGSSFLWIPDLSQPDTVAHIPGIGFPLNPLPLIMAVTSIWQMKITPQAPNTDPSMKIVMWLMPVMFLWICYNFSSGLSLYLTVQNLFSILQTYMTKDRPVEPPKKIKSNQGGGLTFGRPVESKQR